MEVNSIINSNACTSLRKVHFKGEVSSNVPAGVAGVNNKIDQDYTLLEIKGDKINKPVNKQKKSNSTGFKKIFIKADEYSAALFKGTFWGLITSAVMLGIIKIKKNIDKSIEKEAKKLSVKNKVMAGIAGGIVLAFNLFKAHLRVEERTFVVDYRKNQKSAAAKPVNDGLR